MELKDRETFLINRIMETLPKALKDTIQLLQPRSWQEWIRSAVSVMPSFGVDEEQDHLTVNVDRIAADSSYPALQPHNQNRQVSNSAPYDKCYNCGGKGHDFHS